MVASETVEVERMQKGSQTGLVEVLAEWVWVGGSTAVVMKVSLRTGRRIQSAVVWMLWMGCFDAQVTVEFVPTVVVVGFALAARRNLQMMQLQLLPFVAVAVVIAYTMKSTKA